MKHCSLFSGMGGFDLAAKAMGWDNVAHCEIKDYQRYLLGKRFPESKSVIDVKDIARFSHEYKDLYEDGECMWCERHDKEFSECDCIGYDEWQDEIGQIDVLTGGFPCVDITAAKNAIEKPKGLAGAESGLWYEYKRICGLLRPRYAVVENSANLNIRGLYAVAGGFAEIGYDCIWFNVSASRIGAPHRRIRTFIIAYPNQPGLEGNVGKELAREVERRFDPNITRPNWWSSEPGLDRLANGVPGGVEFKKERLEAGGNAVVPQVAYQIFKAIEAYSLTHNQNH